MLVEWEEGGRAERVGSVSIRYMRMKPRIRERPTQACGVRWVGWGGSEEGGEGGGGAGLSLRIPISPGVVGVLGGVVELLEVRSRSAGMTGPGSASNGSVGGGLRVEGQVRAGSHRVSRGGAVGARRVCVWGDALAL